MVVLPNILAARGEAVPLRERFVICELTGGLGNQLFQYAAARALSVREQRDLYFAWHLSRSSTQRSFMLDQYALGERVHRKPLSRFTLCRLGLRSPIAPRKAGKLWRSVAGRRVQHLSEPSFAYAPLASQHARVVIDGYFQSWRYFAGQEPEIRAGLTLRAPLRGKSAQLLQQIETSNAVCLHVRRGDYVSHAQTAAFHGTLDLAYYRAGIAALGARAERATFYVFSDDPAWSREHVKVDGPTVIVEPAHADRPWEDLRLMSACRHFVIANSSFSWWGAWLSSYADKLVVAPSRWFAGGDNDTRDLCPPAWIRL